MTLKTLFAVVLAGACMQTGFAQDEQADRMRTALAAPARPAESKERDADRKPIDTIQFLQIETGDKVIEMVAAFGWFTEVLSAAVGPEGRVYASNPPGMVPADVEKALHDRLGNVEAVHTPLAATSIDGTADAAVVILNLHDIYNGFDGQAGGEATAVDFLKTIHAELKPGGVLGIIDHVGIAGQDNAALHRMPTQQARDALTKAGFVIEAESPLFAAATDDHTKGVFDPSLRGKTDQFMLRARKPQ
ncbi:MAG: methyltransferase [Pseudomonadota bacterium]